MEDIIPFVARHYRTIENRESRAIAGLSAGGGTTINVGLASLDTFAWVAEFSSGIFGGVARVRATVRYREDLTGLLQGSGGDQQEAEAVLHVLRHGRSAHAVPEESAGRIPKPQDQRDVCGHFPGRTSGRYGATRSPISRPSFFDRRSHVPKLYARDAVSQQAMPSRPATSPT